MPTAKTDLTGQRFGHLTVICPSELNGKGNRFKWHCQCDCGNFTDVITYPLTHGLVKSCNCSLKQERNHNYKDLTGKVFGRLTVIKDAGRTSSKNVLWECRCECGNIVTVRTNSLTSGNTRSCGCLHTDISREIAPMMQANSKHYAADRLYKVWRSMLNRCKRETDPGYNRYGGRGITVCDEWLKYPLFKEWAYENGYDENAPRGECTIDRIDNDKGYSPENCRWVNRITQENNKRTNRFVEYNGETHTVAEWARILSIDAATLYRRLYRGLPVEKVFAIAASKGA